MQPAMSKCLPTNLPALARLPTGVPDKAIDEARLAGLPLSGGRDEEVRAGFRGRLRLALLPGGRRGQTLLVEKTASVPATPTDA
jgi:hypothetical protein